MNSQNKPVRKWLVQPAYGSIRCIHRYSLLAYRNAFQKASTTWVRVGALMLVAIPITEVAIGMDLIATVALFAPEAVLMIGVTMVAAFCYRWWDRQRSLKSIDYRY